jgi:hypothetical protein
MFKEGMTVKITKDVSQYGRVLGKTGVIEEKKHHSYWHVRVDGDPGFKNQNGCWMIKGSEMEIIMNIKSNSEAAKLLDKEW